MKSCADHDRMSEQMAQMQVILEKLTTGIFEKKGKEKSTINGSSDKAAKPEERVEDVEVQEVEEAPVKEQQSLRQSMVLRKEKLIDHEGALILSNSIDSLLINYFIKSKRVDFIRANDFNWVFSPRLVDQSLCTLYTRLSSEFHALRDKRSYMEVVIGNGEKRESTRNEEHNIIETTDIGDA